MNYLIHDNGGRPFKVRIDQNVCIYKNTNNDEANYQEYETNPILTFEAPQKVFIGTSPLNEMTQFSGGSGPRFDGNSILLHIRDLEYVFIGWNIFAFRAIATISEYISPVGNNDVPYPYATDVNNNIYLLIDDIVIKYDPERDMSDYDDPYNYYYDHTLIVSNGRNHIGCRGAPKIENFKSIKKIYAGKRRQSLRYSPFADKSYDTDTDYERKAISVVYTNDQRSIFSKSEYIELIQSYGELLSFEPIQNMVVLQERQ